MTLVEMEERVHRLEAEVERLRGVVESGRGSRIVPPEDVERAFAVAFRRLGIEPRSGAPSPTEFRERLRSDGVVEENDEFSREILAMREE